jgi:hypothetical protein
MGQYVEITKNGYLSIPKRSVEKTFGIAKRKMSTNYDRGDVVIVPFPFVTSEGALQKARPVLIIS